MVAAGFQCDTFSALAHRGLEDVGNLDWSSKLEDHTWYMTFKDRIIRPKE
jgi:hypothetical protein